MSEAPIHETRTFTALYRDHVTAERALERLRAAGVPEGALIVRRASETDRELASGGGGLFAALGEFFMPEPDRHSYARGLERGGTVIVVTGIPAELGDTALDILDEDAVDIEATEEEDAGQTGAIGTPGGVGRATGDVDRLTGEPIGGPRQGRRVEDPRRRVRIYEPM
jgi:hypothetical protein